MTGITLVLTYNPAVLFQFSPRGRPELGGVSGVKHQYVQYYGDRYNMNDFFSFSFLTILQCLINFNSNFKIFFM